MSELLKYLKTLDTPAQEKFAIRCGTTLGAMRKGVYTGQRPGIEKCVAIAVESGGAVKPAQLRPDVDWPYLRDALQAIELAPRAAQGVAP